MEWLLDNVGEFLLLIVPGVIILWLWIVKPVWNHAREVSMDESYHPSKNQDKSSLNSLFFLTWKFPASIGVFGFLIAGEFFTRNQLLWVRVTTFIVAIFLGVLYLWIIRKLGAPQIERGDGTLWDGQEEESPKG